MISLIKMTNTSIKWKLPNFKFNQTRKKSTREIEKTVIISKSNNIYTNLALEEWFYRNWDFANKHLLMLWINRHCVVIGKFQNPWLECNVPELQTLLPNQEILLARRNSGGGTVYHDTGNLNLTFFTTNEDCKRKHNLEIVKNAIKRRFDLDINISDRDDLIWGEFKVSGTAAKYARKTSYHHCTLLVNANKSLLSRSLQKPNYTIKTKATQSTRSPIKNLNELNENITVRELIKCISKEYLKTTPYIKGDYNLKINPNYDVKEVLPTENNYPGILEIRDELIGDDWIYGKCPDFTAIKHIILHETQIEIKIFVVKGHVSEVNLKTLTSKYLRLCDEKSDFEVNLDEFKNRKFSEHLFDEIKFGLKSSLNIKIHM